MQIGVQCWGSHGDIRPLLALAGGLQSAGHAVRVLVTSVDPGNYDDLASALSVGLEYVASPVVADNDAFERINADIFRQANPLEQARSVVNELFEPAAEEMYAAAETLCRDSDLVVGHFFHYPLRIAAEKVGCPYASVMLVHSAIPTRHYPPAGMPDLGAWGNRLLWRLVRGVLNRNLKPFADRMRVDKGLAPAKDLLDDVWASADLNLIAVSKVLCPRQDDWTDNHQVCGYLDLPDLAARGEALLPDLEGFLNEGAPPVYVSFGSVTPSRIEAQRDLIGLLREAAELARCRMIIQAPLWRECGAEPTSGIHYVSAAPHAIVFPRCAAVVHHGGAGTCHSATMAGTPSVVVAHIDEQRFWGKQLQRIGVAAAPLLRRTLTAKSLAVRIADALNTPGMATNAQTAAAVMRGENGVGRAVDLITKKFVA